MNMEHDTVKDDYPIEHGFQLRLLRKMTASINQLLWLFPIDVLSDYSRMIVGSPARSYLLIISQWPGFHIQSILVELWQKYHPTASAYATQSCEFHPLPWHLPIFSSHVFCSRLPTHEFTTFGHYQPLTCLFEPETNHKWTTNSPNKNSLATTMPSIVDVACYFVAIH